MSSQHQTATTNFDYLQSNLLVIALGFLFIKGIIIFINFLNLKKDNEIIAENIARVNKENFYQALLQQSQQPPYSLSTSIDVVNNWRTEDFRLSHDMRQQFLTKTKTRRSHNEPQYGYRAVSPKEQIPLAIPDDNEGYNNEYLDAEGVPIYQYNPSINGTQV